MDVLLHIGQGKTGTSFMQAAFAFNAKQLAEQGVIYPFGKSQQKAAQKGALAQPNVMTLDEIIAQTKRFKNRTDITRVLFSNENLYGVLSYDQTLLHQLKSLGVKVKVLVFTRCPMESLQSYYAQKVKAAGYAGTFKDYLRAIDYSMPLSTELDTLISACDRLDIDVNLYNYSHRKNDLLQLSEQFMGVPEGTLAKPERLADYNRSLAPDEVLLAQVFNKYYGKATNQFLTTPLRDLTDIKAEKVLPHRDDLERYIRNINREIAAYNAKYQNRFDTYDVIDIDKVKGIEMPQVCTLTIAQLECVAEAMSKVLVPRKKSWIKRLKALRIGKFKNLQLPKENPQSKVQ